MALAKLFDEAGLPPGCLNVVWGVPAKVSDYLIRSPIVRKVSFTGSVPIGKQLASLAGAHMKRMTMELGGHSPVLICGDPDLDQAVPLLARLKALNAGQVCMAPSCFYVQESIFDEFTERFTKTFSSRVVGDGLDEATTMGPLAHSRRISAMKEFVEDALQCGATLAAGGEALKRPGNFFPPTVLMNAPDRSRIMREEPFGPVAPVTPFETMEEAVTRANSLPYGLASYVFTRSLKNSHYASSRLEAGMVSINLSGSRFRRPRSAVKDSGIGSEGGTETFDAYTTTKFITEDAA